MCPERREDEFIVQEQSDLIGEALPDSIIDAMIAVELNETFEKSREPFPFACERRLKICCVCRVEADPEENESYVQIFPLLLGATEPAQGTVHPKGQGDLKSIP